MDIVVFTVVGAALYLPADALIERIERLRGARFQSWQLAFFAIILPLALAAFWLLRALSGP